MPSSRFLQLQDNVHELKVVYLDDGLAAPVPSAEHQERARAFVMFAHAEIEWFVERVCIDFCSAILTEANNDRVSSSTLALLTFAPIEALNGGGSLGKKTGARSLSERVGNAKAKQQALAESNDGIRELHLSKLLVPLGLNASHVDQAWLADLDAFCSQRGGFAHMSRSEGRASHLAVNPSDVWQLCERLIWGGANGSGLVASFEGLDDWISKASQSFATVSTVDGDASLWSRIRRWFRPNSYR